MSSPQRKAYDAARYQLRKEELKRKTLEYYYRNKTTILEKMRVYQAERRKEIAELTKSTGVQWVVDHIYPLKSNIVCGLHTEANLQVITRDENSRKGNKHPDE